MNEASKTRHLPRRSGTGARQVVPAAKTKVKYRRRRPMVPATCGSLNPERPGIVDDATGEQLVDPIYCTAETKYHDGKPVKHRGRHRARLLTGIVIRWDVEASA